MLQFCSVSNSLSHTTLSNKLREYFSKNCVARLYCVVIKILYESAYEYTTIVELFDNISIFTLNPYQDIRICDVSPDFYLNYFF